MTGDRALRAVQAVAFTAGTDVVLDSTLGDAGPDRRVIVHELAHVRQQATRTSTGQRPERSGGSPAAPTIEVSDTSDPDEVAAEAAATRFPTTSIGAEGAAGPALRPTSAMRVQRQAAAPPAAGCPTYEADERDRSAAPAGVIAPDVVVDGGRLIIRDFPVDSTGVRPSTAADPLLASWLAVFESDPSYHVSILGYSDCVGGDPHNNDLRQERASAVERLLGAGARSRVAFRGQAALGSYLGGNSTPTDRAGNRAVVIELSQEMTFPAETITAPRPTPPPTTSPLPMVDCTASNTSEIAPAIPIARDMVRKAIRVLGGPANPAVDALLQKYFNDHSASTYLHTLVGYRALLGGISGSFTIECEQPGSLLYSHFCRGTYAYVKLYPGTHVHICGLAFGRSATDLAETIVHESSHKFDGTDDEAYCWRGSCPPSLGRWDAYDNADSFSKFAWEAWTTIP